MAAGASDVPGHSAGGVLLGAITCTVGLEASGNWNEMPSSTASPAAAASPRMAKAPVRVIPLGSVAGSGPAGPVAPTAPGGPVRPTAPSCDRSTACSFALQAAGRITTTPLLLLHSVVASAAPIAPKAIASTHRPATSSLILIPPPLPLLGGPH